MFVRTHTLQREIDCVVHAFAHVAFHITGKDAKDIFASTGLPNSKLFKIWKIADVDGDGALDSDEFSVAMFIVDQVNAGGEIPDVLPPSLVPPSKR